MRINKISVRGLFGIFNHDIPLNVGKDRITIIHSPNGFGKTVILKMLNGIFNSQYFELINIPFENFQIEFDDGSNLDVTKKIDNINFCFHKVPSNPSLLYVLKKLKINAEEDWIDQLEEYLIPDIVRISSENWQDLTTGEKLSLQTVIDRFGDLVFSSSKFIQQQPEWLKNLQNQIQVRLIQSQRLLNLAPNYDQRKFLRRSSNLSTVSAYSEELAERMENKFTEYGNISQSLDRTFPVRVVQQQQSIHLTDDELYQKLDDLETKRSRLIDLGLLNQEEDSEFQIKPPSLDETTKNILSVYVEDMEKKLGVFDDIADKIDLFGKIINKKFSYSYKKIDFSKDKGFIFTSFYTPSLSETKTLSPTELSSGEQHELVLLYELLFNVEPDSLVLIDEPELSLHVGWQVEFLKDLQDIIKIAKFDILMATHSPDLIQDRWDLTVELKGPR